jgi:NitT/TauT family transport system substrate-binding protein
MTALVTACGGSSTTSAGGVPSLPVVSGVEKPTLNVSVLPSLDSAGFFVALNEGLFSQEGLKINYEPASGDSSQVVQQQMSGQVDISDNDYVSYVESQVSHQADLKIFAEGSVLEPGDQVIMAMPTSPITTLTKLRGHYLGVESEQSIGYMLVKAVLAEHGISIGTAHTADSVWLPPHPIGFMDMGPALSGGQVAAAVMTEPQASLYSEQWGAVPIADLDQGDTEQFPIVGYAVTSAWAAKYPRTLDAFYTALEAGQQIADTDRAAVEQAYEALNGAPAGHVDAPVAAMMALNNYPVSTDPSRLQRTITLMRQSGLLTKTFNISSMLIYPQAGGDTADS